MVYDHVLCIHACVLFYICVCFVPGCLNKPSEESSDTLGELYTGVLVHVPLCSVVCIPLLQTYFIALT